MGRSTLSPAAALWCARPQPADGACAVFFVSGTALAFAMPLSGTFTILGPSRFSRQSPKGGGGYASKIIVLHGEMLKMLLISA